MTSLLLEDTNQQWERKYKKKTGTSSYEKDRRYTDNTSKDEQDKHISENRKSGTGLSNDLGDSSEH